MQAQRTVTLYVGNRIDGAIEVDPAALAAEFVQAARDGFDLPQRGSVEFAYRWWIANPKGRNSTWDESDWESMILALVEHFAANPAVKDEMWERVDPWPGNPQPIERKP